MADADYWRLALDADIVFTGQSRTRPALPHRLFGTLRFPTPEPAFDADEVLDRIGTVQEENLKRLDDDLDILKSYLKTQAPKAAIEALEGLTVEQHVSWKSAMDRIKKLLGE